MKKTIAVLFCLLAFSAFSQQKKRARDLGIPFNGTPGTYNAITDVAGVEVGFKTLIQGEGELVVGNGPIRTGVTVILPNGKNNGSYPAAMYSLNGDGEFTGSQYIQDYGAIPGAAIGITNTNSVGVVRDAIGEWQIEKFSTGEMDDFSFGLPPVGETWDGHINDINGLHVKKEHVFEALNTAKGGPVAEGNVGGGTGMWLYGFKGGTGTASRVITIDSVAYTIGVLVQANFGYRGDLTVAGVPVGKEITDLLPVFNEPQKDGSLIVVLATDAPLLPSQLNLVARRIPLGVARTGTISGNGSGDIFLTFSTHVPVLNDKESLQTWTSIPKWKLDPIYRATVEATEEAIINALVAAETMVGTNGNTLYECPEDRLVQVLKKYNRIK